MAVSVKTYLNFLSGQPEIRRFSVPEDVSSSYLYLTEKIQRVYPALLRKNLELLWQDNDGELVTFSTDEELMEALQHVKDFLKIFVKVKEEKDDNKQEGGSPAEEHVGVVCDVCDGSIKGTRFKCMVCRDYDLCGSCESQGFHPEHEMVRLRKPRRHANWCGRGFRGRQMPHRGHHCGRGSRPPFRSWGSPYGPGPSPFRCPNGPWNPPPPRAAGTSGPSTDNQNPPRGPEWGPNVNVPEYFRAFGEYLGSVLHPFGVHVETYVDPPVPEGQGMDGQNASMSDTQHQETTDAPPMAEGGKTAENSHAADADPPDEVFGNNAPVVESATKPAQDPDFVMVDSERASVDDSSKEKPEEEAKAPSDDPFQRRLDEAVAQMEAMGFKNDDGWLTQLLVSKDCDVGRVINTILPQGRFT